MVIKTSYSGITAYDVVYYLTVEKNLSVRDIEEVTGVAKSAVHRILNRESTGKMALPKFIHYAYLHHNNVFGIRYDPLANTPTYYQQQKVKRTHAAPNTQVRATPQVRFRPTGNLRIDTENWYELNPREAQNVINLNGGRENFLKLPDAQVEARLIHYFLEKTRLNY